jgi:ribosome biogenesis GTPase
MLLNGLLIKAHSGFFTVHTENHKTIVCKAAGRLTKTKHVEDALAVGDRVVVEEVTSEDWVTGRIISVAKRNRTLSRLDPVVNTNERAIRQIIVANLDLVVFVCSCKQPDFHTRMLDRYLVGAEAQKLPVLICATKTDLVGESIARTLFATYENIGYSVHFVSTKTDRGVEALRELLNNKISVLTGKSGVGKSSLLNALKPGLAQEIGAISEQLQKGKHTTVAPQLFNINENSWLADTPGLRAYSIWDVSAEELDGYYRDIAPFVEHCEFSNCTHTHEPRCAVIKAVENGAIEGVRYDSYVRLYKELSRQRRW